MKKFSRRDKMKIYGDILLMLTDESAQKKIAITKIQSRLNIPFTRFKKYITDLIELGLIYDETSLKVTEKGKQYLKEYENVLEFLTRMGMSYK